MADLPSSESRPSTIRIHVVSPSLQVPSRLTFESVPLTETIADLKRRIRDTVPSRPALESQRIIYRGRALIQHDLTFQSVLGSEALNASDPFTFHLVISPLESNNQPAGLRSDSVHQPMGLPTVPSTHGLRASNMPPRPASTSQVPEGGQQAMPHVHNMPHNMPFNPLFNMIPPGLQPGQGMDIRMQITQTGRTFPPNMTPGVTNPPLQTSAADEWVALTQQIRGEMAQREMQHQARHQTLHQAHQQAHQNVVNRGQHHNNTGSINHQHPQPTVANTNSQRISVETWPHRSSVSNESPASGVETPPSQQTSSTSGLDATRDASRHHTATRQLPQSGMHGVGPHFAANLHAIRQNQLQNMQIDQMAQFNQLHNAMMNPFQPPRPSMTPQLTPTVYLLSSPSGPEAVLVTPLGTFTSPQLVPSSEQMSYPQSIRTIPTSAIQTQIHTPPQVHQGPQPQQQQPPQQQQQQQQQDPAGDLVRILLPLGGHLWLLVRLIGFVYLFSGGRGWRNTIVLGLLALIGFLAQTGMFNPLIRNVWRPVRQHVEGIINHEHPRPRAAEDQGPNPQQMADRLLERQDHQNPLRRAARRIERSAILFAASLIPGVGESQVRARERVEQEQREAEQAAERARLEAEQQAEQQTQDKEAADGEGKLEDISTERLDTKEAPQGQSSVHEQPAQVD